VLRSGLRRLSVLFVGIFVLTCAVSLVVGALVHANLSRALADGFYVAGAAVLIGSFILGLRGPMRPDYGEEQASADMPVPIAGGGLGGLGGMMPRAIRRTSLDERVDARRNSIALFAVGLALVLIGAGFDPSRHAF
jgi:hypothetical protein